MRRKEVWGVMLDGWCCLQRLRGGGLWKRLVLNFEKLPNHSENAQKKRRFLNKPLIKFATTGGMGSVLAFLCCHCSLGLQRSKTFTLHTSHFTLHTNTIQSACHFLNHIFSAQIWPDSDIDPFLNEAEIHFQCPTLQENQTKYPTNIKGEEYPAFIASAAGWEPLHLCQWGDGVIQKHS